MSSQDLRSDTAAVGPTDTEFTGITGDTVDAADPAGSPSGGASRRRWRWVRRIALWLLGVVVVLALVASGLVVWSVRRSSPEYGGTVTLPGLAAPVTVYR